MTETVSFPELLIVAELAAGLAWGVGRLIVPRTGWASWLHAGQCAGLGLVAALGIWWMA